MSYLIAIGISLFVSAIVSYFWVRGIDYMNTHHPDYKGEDFLNWNEQDENKNHTEGDFH